MAVITIVKEVKKIHPKEIVILMFLVVILICLISKNFKTSINKDTNSINSINQESKVSTNIDFNTSDADAFILIDDTRNVYNDYTGKQVAADFWSFLLKDKRNSIKDSKCTIIDKEGTTNTKNKDNKRSRE